MATKAAGWGRTATDDELKTMLPKLYVYDHCPFCVRTRMIFGLRNMQYDLVFVANDDAATPTRLVGRKLLPILEMDGEAMGESLDIVQKIDADGPVLKPASGREDIKAFMKETTNLQRKLTRPRLARTPLAEFQSKSARKTYEDNHPIPDGTSYDDCIAQTPQLLVEFNEELKKLDAMLFSEEYATEGGVSYDDIELFPRVRGFTMVRGVVFPPKLDAYARSMAERCDIPLFYYCAS